MAIRMKNGLASDAQPSLENAAAVQARNPVRSPRKEAVNNLLITSPLYLSCRLAASLIFRVKVFWLSSKTVDSEVLVNKSRRGWLKAIFRARRV